jgi:uncharacterized membrane protein
VEFLVTKTYEIEAIIGHLHPLIVHVPIGTFIFAFVISILPRAKREALGSALELALIIGILTSISACIAGYLLAQSGDYDSALVLKHQWTGIATAVLSIVAYLLKAYRRILIWLTCILMAIAGHFGGTLTHGEGYLFSGSTEQQSLTDSIPTIPLQKSEITDSTNTLAETEEVFLYRDQIKPIFQNKCYGCHSQIKRKGQLRLDTEAFILQGGKNGKIIKTGNAGKSRLYTHLILPLEDDLHMPPKGKKQLTAKEINIIHEWIDKGNPFGSITINTKQDTTKAISIISESTIQLSAAIPVAEHTISVEKNIPAADQSEIDLLESKNVIVNKIKEESNELSINFVNVKNLQPSIVDDLAKLNQQVVTLKLSNQPITDEFIQKLTGFKQLRQLQLENTKITDAGLIDINNLDALQQLNLYGTNITDKGLSYLIACKNLKTIYLWKTKTTLLGINQLKKALPHVKIESGNFEFYKLDTIKK